MYHGKHARQADDNDKFVAIYNAGISSRLLGEFDRAAHEFEEALQVAKQRVDYESMSLCFGQLAIAHLLRRDMDAALECFNDCLELARELRAVKMQLECLLCTAYIAFDKQDWKDAKEYFDEAYFVSKDSGETHIAEQCLCNAGIASGNAMMDDKKRLFTTFYQNNSDTNNMRS